MTDEPSTTDAPTGLLHHVELYASDYDASTEFWHWLLVEHLDHEPYQEFEGGRSWRRGVPILYEDDHPHAGGPDHYAVYFESPERVKVEVVAPE